MDQRLQLEGQRHDLLERRKELLEYRDRLQKQLDTGWTIDAANSPADWFAAIGNTPVEGGGNTYDPEDQIRDALINNSGDLANLDQDLRRVESQLAELPPDPAVKPEATEPAEPWVVPLDDPPASRTSTEDIEGGPVEVDTSAHQGSIADSLGPNHSEPDDGDQGFTPPTSTQNVQVTVADLPNGTPGSTSEVDEAFTANLRRELEGQRHDLVERRHKLLNRGAEIEKKLDGDWTADAANSPADWLAAIGDASAEGKGNTYDPEKPIRDALIDNSRDLATVNQEIWSIESKLAHLPPGPAVKPETSEPAEPWVVSLKDPPPSNTSPAPSNTSTDFEDGPVEVDTPAKQRSIADELGPSSSVPDDGDQGFTPPPSPQDVPVTIADSTSDIPGVTTEIADVGVRQNGSAGFFAEHRALTLAVVGAVVVVAAVGIGVALGSGGNSGGSPGTHGRSSDAAGASLSESLPTLTGRPLQFSAFGSSASTPSTYLVTLRPGTEPGQFVESDSYPATGSQQIDTEVFSAHGVEITNLETSSSSGASSFDFSTPLPVIEAPYAAGRQWNVSSTGRSTIGSTSDSVQVSDQITGTTRFTVGGTSLQVVKLRIHHFIAEFTPSGRVTQESTGTEYFSPILGVFVWGQSTELVGGRSTTNQFTLESIGTPTSGSATGSPGASTAGLPAITVQPHDQTCALHGTAPFSVAASGSQPLRYQWQQLNGATWSDIPGATAMGWSQECLSSTHLRVVVSNSQGSATSYAVTLTVQG